MDELEPGTGLSETDGTGTADDRFSVLEVFGLKLEVSNPRLAELLTMDAREALVTDVKDLVSDSPADARAEVAEAIPDAVVAAATPKGEEDARIRQEFRATAESLGVRLGFSTRPDGLWSSPAGLRMLTRTVEKNVSLAAASHFVSEVATHRESVAGPDATALFIVDSQQTADVFKVAIRQRRLYNVMRTISVPNLTDIVGLVEAGILDHRQALVLLAPMENIDVGEVLSVIKAASGA